MVEAPRPVSDDSSGSSDQAAGPSSGEPKESDQPAPKRSMFGFLKQTFKKAVDALNTDIRDLVGKEGRLCDEEFLDELYRMLIKTDMGAGPAEIGRAHV